MATTKNITMKQFNGTDYDTLYPKTKVEQVENLTPSSIGAVAKTGDTMTGNLVVPTLNVAPNVSAGYIYGETNSLNIRGGNPNTGLMHYFGIKDSGVYVDNQLVCHEGNLLSIGSTMGIARSQSGSYVGTGTYGSSNPCSITFSFKPKIVIFPNDLVYNARGKSMIAVDCLTTSYQDVDGTLGYEVYAKFDTTTNTLYWYASTRANEYHQLNRAGETYYWVAIG